MICKINQRWYYESSHISVTFSLIPILNKKKESIVRIVLILCIDSKREATNEFNILSKVKRRIKRKANCAVYIGVNDWTCQIRFVKFRAYVFLLNHTFWSSRLAGFDSCSIKTLLQNNNLYTRQKTSSILKVYKAEDENNLRNLGYAGIYDVWFLIIQTKSA